MNHTDTIAGTIGGTFLTALSMITKVVAWDNLAAVATTAFVAATVSFFTSKLWRKLFKND
jgi:hypothetical protein